jgi:hypothetical protein
MAILVQRVSGSRYQDFYMPCAAGVGYSISPYRFSPEHPSQGMLRLVMGLGTAAVDRRTGSYPRMVMMEDPTKVTLTSSSDKHQFSQRLVDAVRFASGEVEGLDPDTTSFVLDTYWVQHGGGDVRYWIEKLAGRVDILHLKDMKRVLRNDNVQQITEVGNGNLSWDLILDTAQKTGVKYYVVEQDTGYAVNCFQSIRQSAEYLRKFMN